MPDQPIDRRPHLVLTNTSTTGAFTAPSSGGGGSTISGFLRLVTNAKILSVPSSSAQAVDFVDWLLEDAQVRLLGNTSEWVVFRRLILDKRLAVNHIPNAHLAALSLSISEPLVTFDKGFRQLLPRSLLVLLAGN